MRLQIKYAKKIFFENRIFYVFNEVYEPAEDTFLIAENLHTKPNDIVLDLGTGCGILAILAASKARRVIATDINPYAVRCAKLNAKINKVSDKIEFLCGDLFKPMRQKEEFDLIFFNAPYLPTEKDEPTDWIDYTWTGGRSGRKVIDQFIIFAPKYLKSNGKILLVQSSLSNVDKTIKRLERQGLRTKIMEKKKIAFEEITLIMAEKPN